jgi:hypothetical protein
MMRNIIAAAGAALLLSAVAAHAAPITTNPTLTASGDVTAVYIFSDAGDQSIMSELGPTPISPIFCNFAQAGCLTGAGTTLDLGVQSGTLQFGLNNTSTGTLFTSTTTASDGDYHVLITTNYADFNEGALSGAALTAVNNLIAAGETVTFVGWEDLVGGDYDYNDLIFAFGNTTTDNVPVPEPISISLFGAGLVGAAWANKRRKANKA